MKKSQNRSYVLQGCFRLLALVLAILPYRPAHAYESNKVQQLITRAVKGEGEAKLELGRIYAQNGELSEASNGLSQLRNRVLEKAKRLLDTPSLRVSGSLRMKLKD